MALGGDADERLLVLVRPGVGEDLDVDLGLRQLQLLEGKPDRVLDGDRLDLDAGEPVAVSTAYAISHLALFTYDARRATRGRDPN